MLCKGRLINPCGFGGVLINQFKLLLTLIYKMNKVLKQNFKVKQK